MVFRIIDYGSDNRVVNHGSDIRGEGAITFRGDGNLVEIADGCMMADAQFDLGDHNHVAIGANSNIAHLEIYSLRGSSITLGERAAFSWSVRIHAHEAFDVTIGDDSLISDGVWITVSDMHSIIDQASGQRINHGKPVTVGNHVWLGKNVSLMKGAKIGSGSIVATGSIVTNEIPENCIAAGVPAKVLRRGVEWDQRLLP